jgi:hypothetical protein
VFPTNAGVTSAQSVNDGSAPVDSTRTERPVSDSDRPPGVPPAAVLEVTVTEGDLVAVDYYDAGGQLIFSVHGTLG